MSHHKIVAKKRKSRQYIMAIFFILLLLAARKYPVLGYFIPACMVLGIGIAMFKGRKWCDWYCPRGSFVNTMLRPLSPEKKIP